jgi:large subunit ribosomal protein L11
MAKKVAAVVRFHVPAGKAMAGPPVGPALAPHGVNVMEFVKAYNTQTASQVGSIIPVEVTVYQDRSFTFVLKTPPASELLRKAAGLEKGAKQAGREDAGQVSRDQIADIARQKMRDLNTDDLEQAMRVIEGTARSMGIKVV